MISDMFPTSPKYNIANHRVGYFVLGRKFALRVSTCGVLGTNVAHGGFSELGLAVGLAVVRCAVACAALRFHIGHVVSLSTKKQVGRIDARWGIATVKYAQVSGDGAVMDFPRKAMGANQLHSASERAVAIGGCTPRPQPTPTRMRPFIDVFPKPFFYSTVFTWHQKNSYGKPQEFRYTHSCDRRLYRLSPSPGTFPRRLGFSIAAIIRHTLPIGNGKLWHIATTS